MPTTLKYGIQYPAGTVAPNVPIVMQTMAESVEAAIDEAADQTVPVTTTDINWAYHGGLYLMPSTASKSRVSLNLRLTRIAGGSVALTTTPILAMNLIPTGYRPAGYSLTRYTVLQSSAGTDVWGMYVRIDKDGNLLLSANSGSASIVVGNQIELDMTWLLP